MIDPELELSYSELFRPPADALIVRSPLGELRIRSGIVAAVDPITRSAVIPTAKLPRGSFPVFVIQEATSAPHPDRLALALELSDAEITRWEPARLEGCPPPEPGRTVGVPIDSARAGLLDAADLDSMADLARDTRMSEGLHARGELSLAVCRSGAGDGVYPIWLGYADDDAMVCALLDFGMVRMKPQPLGEERRRALIETTRADLGGVDVRRGLGALPSLGPFQAELAPEVLALVKKYAEDDCAWRGVALGVGDAVKAIVQQAPATDELIRAASEASEPVLLRYMEIVPSERFQRWAAKRTVDRAGHSPLGDRLLWWFARRLPFDGAMQLRLALVDGLIASGSDERAARVCDALADGVPLAKPAGPSDEASFHVLLEGILEHSSPAAALRLHRRLLIRRDERARELRQRLGFDEAEIQGRALATIEDDSTKADLIGIKCWLREDEELLGVVVERVMTRAERQHLAPTDPVGITLVNYVGDYLYDEGRLGEERVARLVEAVQTSAPAISSAALDSTLRRMKPRVLAGLGRAPTGREARR